MTFPTYFRLSLFLPIVLGIIAGTLLIESPAGILALAIIAEGLAYSVLIALVLLWSLGRAQGKLKFASVLMPPIFVPISLAGHVLNDSIQTTDELFGAVMSIGLMILVIGYFYVAVAWAGWFFYSWLKSGTKNVT